METMSCGSTCGLKYLSRPSLNKTLSKDRNKTDRFKTLFENPNHFIHIFYRNVLYFAMPFLAVHSKHFRNAKVNSHSDYIHCCKHSLSVLYSSCNKICFSKSGAFEKREKSHEAISTFLIVFILNLIRFLRPSPFNNFH